MQEKLIVNLSQEETIQATVPDINYIPAYKVAEEQRRANELERISNENEREAYYEDLQEKVDSGEMDGKNTVYVGETEPIDDFYEVWVNPEGTPEVSAENLVFSDNETLQDKYDNGELKGPQGTTDYNDLENKPTIPTKTSELENDNGFITGYEETDPTVPSHVKAITEADITHWNNGGVTGDTLPVGAEVEYNGDTVPIGWEEIENPYQQIDGEVVKTGRKVFGKDEYVYTKTITSITGILTGLTNVDYVTDIKCMVLDTATPDGFWRPIPWCHDATTYDASYNAGLFFKPSNGGVGFQIGEGIRENVGKGIISIYFTYKD